MHFQTLCCPFQTLHDFVVTAPPWLTRLPKLRVRLLLHIMVNLPTPTLYPSDWNNPAGKSNQLCKSPKSGWTAQAGNPLRLTSGGETCGVASELATTAEYAVRLRSRRTWMASGRFGLLSDAEVAESHFRLARSRSLT